MHIIKTQRFTEDDIGFITPEMFSTDNIDTIAKKDGEFVFIIFHGLNGGVPFRWFDQESKKIILDWVKITNTQLWRAMHG